MAFDDLRSFLQALDDHGQLLKISEEVNAEPDLAAAANATGRIGDGAPALWFDNIRGFIDARVAMNTIGSWQNHAISLGLPPNTPVKKQIDEFIRRWDNFPIAPERRVVVKDGESLSLGAHTLTFVFAPMVHWPEVMVSYESTEKVLFSADGFGRFGAVAKFDEKADWASEARRYYLNIVGKYGPQVQALLKKAAALDIQTICPLHGPVLTGDLGKYLNYYDIWSSYKPEEPEKILVASASIHGHTRAAAHLMAEKLRAKGAKVVEMDLTRTDVSYAVTEAFRCGKIVLACATYDGFLFPPMENLLTHLKTKSFQNRTVGLMENGTWAPMAAKFMRAELESMKNIAVCDTVVTIRSAANAAAEAQMDALAAEIVAK